MSLCSHILCIYDSRKIDKPTTGNDGKMKLTGGVARFVVADVQGINGA